MALTGGDAIVRRLRRLAVTIPAEVGGALREEAEIEMTEAKKRTPVATGVLRASGHVVGPVQRGGDVSVSLRFGGPAAGYALYVHENLEAWHRVGQAKYLESVILESAPHLAGRVARRLAKRIAAVAGD